MDIQKIRTRTAAAVLGLSFMGGAALAQTTGTAPATIAPVSDTEAVQFVAANKKVAQVASSMTAELQAAPSDEAAKAVQAKAEQQMIAAIEAEGITPKRYTEIVRLAETDEATLAKLQAEFGG